MGSGGKGEAAILGAVEDGVGDRALHLAAGAGQLEVCRYLVEDLRLDVNQLNFIGGAPFHAPLRVNLQILQLLSIYVFMLIFSIQAYTFSFLDK